jgi:hypothetical protein
MEWTTIFLNQTWYASLIIKGHHWLSIVVVQKMLSEFEYQ